ncbi:uncharacterized protein LOC106078030 [Biomphalaria glabrata]|uniref:Uncharacterized protein LOC106078030 n=1 Tax=Biomphalaria glabrata TaxID=6526 RepID=A0A9U8EMC2_BIOGL|nr:uncharacterized protein LOC106078030 [Biomphalaria glabrata]
MRLLKIVFIVCTGLAASYALTDPVILTAADIKAFLETHNLARKAVGLKDLVWNSTLSASSGTYGSQCSWAHSLGNYGENLYAGYPINTNHTALAASAVKSWVSEKAVQDPPAWKCMTASPTCGHYTQVVWRTTTSVGCAAIHCPQTINKLLANYVLCQYWPRGNYIGKAPY